MEQYVLLVHVKQLGNQVEQKMHCPKVGEPVISSKKYWFEVSQVMQPLPSWAQSKQFGRTLVQGWQLDEDCR